MVVWEDSTNITSSFQGITTPIADLYHEIHIRNWQVTSVKVKDGQYEASASNPHGESASKVGRDEKTALGALLLYIVRREYIRQGSWNQHWADQLEPIAQAYAKAPSFDPQAAAAWKELADDCVARAEQLKQQLQIEVTDDPAPYHSPQDLFEDVTKHQRLQVSRAGSEHPVWTPEQVIAFRIVHDVLGHAAAGGDFGWTGENLATAAHMPYLSPNAQRALFTETVGQKAYNHFYHGYGYPKITFLNDHLEDIQKEQNPPGHGGLPTHHTLSPGVLPERTSSNVIEGDIANYDWGEGGSNRRPIIYHHPTDTFYMGALNASHGNLHDQFPEALGSKYQLGNPDFSYAAYYPASGDYPSTNHYHNVLISDHHDLVDNKLKETLGSPNWREHYDGVNDDDVWDSGEPHFASNVWGYSRLANLKRDPNYQYQTGIAPVVDVPGEYGDPLNYHGLKDMGHALNTNWSQWTRPEDGEPDKERMKQAIVNAFRVAVLSPMKELKWNAAHYQDISHIPYSVTDPKVYWDALEHSRIEYNRSQGIPNPETQHKEHYKSGALLDFYRYYQLHHPEMNVYDAKEAADREVMNLRAGIEEKLIEESKDPDMDILDPKVDKALNKALKQIVSDDKPLHKRGSIAQPQIPEKVDRYGGFIGRHLIAISRIQLYADQLLEAALEDVKRHDGTGHMFRAMALSLNLPFVGPKVASFAWLLLQPLTSQLATIDTHMADILGYKAKDIPTRDYFRAERELQAGRDATGYSHVPLGLFQWGMWDMKRHGQAQDHQDHSALKVNNPTPWRDIDWQPRLPGTRQDKAEQWIPPDWWAVTEPYRTQEKATWNTDVAPYTPQSQIPWKNDPFIIQASGSDEIHASLQIPDNIRQKIAEWLPVIDTDISFVDPSDYHITIMQTKTGLKEIGVPLTRVFNPSGIKFILSSLSSFDEGAVVIELVSPSCRKYQNMMAKWIEDQDINVSVHSSGFKPHITIGYSTKAVPSIKIPPIEFRCGPMTLSTPRDQINDLPILSGRRKHCPKCQSSLDVFGKCTKCEWKDFDIKKPKLTRRILDRLGLTKKAAPVYEHQTPSSFSPGTRSIESGTPFIWDGMAIHLGSPGSLHAEVAKSGGFHYDWSKNRLNYHHGLIIPPWREQPQSTVEFYGPHLLTSKSRQDVVNSLSNHTGIPLQESGDIPVANNDIWDDEPETEPRTSHIKLAKEGVFYHVAPAAARESIALHGLHPRHRVNSPWSPLNQTRPEYPEGNFLWEHPDAAREYVHTLAAKHPGLSNPFSKKPNHEPELERMRDDYNLVDDGSGNVYHYKWPEEEDDGSDPNYGPEEKEYNHETDRNELRPEDQGWDIWETRVPEHTVKPDPEPLFEGDESGRYHNPDLVVPHDEFVQNPSAFGDPYDASDMRWYMPQDVEKEQLRHFEHVPYVSILKSYENKNHPLNNENILSYSESNSVPEVMQRVNWPHYQAYRQFLNSEAWTRWNDGFSENQPSGEFWRERGINPGPDHVDTASPEA